MQEANGLVLPPPDSVIRVHLPADDADPFLAQVALCAMKRRKAAFSLARLSALSFPSCPAHLVRCTVKGDLRLKDLTQPCFPPLTLLFAMSHEDDAPDENDTASRASTSQPVLDKSWTQVANFNDDDSEYSDTEEVL